MTSSFSQENHVNSDDDCSVLFKLSPLIKSFDDIPLFQLLHERHEMMKLIQNRCFVMNNHRWTRNHQLTHVKLRKIAVFRTRKHIIVSWLKILNKGWLFQLLKRKSFIPASIILLMFNSFHSMDHKWLQHLLKKSSSRHVFLLSWRKKSLCRRTQSAIFLAL